MAKFGCPAKFIAMVRQFHDGMLARVQNDGEFSDPFPVTNGVKQGCVLAKASPTELFPQTSLVVSATGSLELRLVSSAILEHTNNNTSHS